MRRRLGEMGRFGAFSKGAGGDPLAGRRRRQRFSEKYNIIGYLTEFDEIRVAIFTITY